MCTKIAVSVREGITFAKKTGEKATKSMHRKNYEGALSAMEAQQSGLKKTEEKAYSMVEIATECENNLAENRKKLNRLEPVVYKMVDEIETLKKRNNNLERNWITWQSASDFVTVLVTYIYPPDTKVTFGPMFTNLMLWLRQNHNTPEGEVANEKWKALQRKAEFQWTDDHTNLLDRMLRCKKIDFDASFSEEDVKRRGEILMMNQFIKSS